MYIIRVEHLRPGHIVGRPLLDERGQVLLHAGVRLTERYIEVLRRKGYSRLYIRDEDLPFEIDIPENISPVTRMRALSSIQKSYETIGQELAPYRTKTFEDMQGACASKTMRDLTSATGPLKSIHDVVSRVLEEIMDRPTLAGMNFIKSEDTELYEHSMDVCVLSLLIGRAIGLPFARMKQLAAGCLLHDIGMLFVKGPIREEDRIRQHTELGYDMLKNSEDPDILAPHVALQHHEHQDGTGLPRGLQSSNRIERNRALPSPVSTLIGEIAALVNGYDDWLRGKWGLPALPHDEALTKIREGAGTLYNRELVAAFLTVMPVFPVGMEVLVLGGAYHGFSGIVTEVRPGSLNAPLVSLYRDRQKNVIEPIEIDMKEQHGAALRPRSTEIQ